MNEVYLLILTYAISFNDADNGLCYAGDGLRLVSAHRDRASAEAIAAKFNPVFTLAEKEHTVFPVQAANRQLKKRFGFTVHDIDDGYKFKLIVETLTIEP